jgi:GTP cyclohydrolase III
VSNAIQTLKRVLGDTKSARRHQELQEVQSDLMARIQHWKNLNVDSFGQLMLFDVLHVVASKSDVQYTVCTIILRTTTGSLVLLLS